jgi:hypothetical protein
MPKGDWVMRRRTRYDSVTTASTNQCSERYREQPGDGQRQPAEGQSVLATRHLGPGKDDDVEDLGEDQGRDREIDVAQSGREIGHESGHSGGCDQPVQDRQPKIGRLDGQQRRGGAVNAEAEQRRVAERHQAGVTDQDVGGHGEQPPDQDLGHEAAPELWQDERRRNQ